MLNGTKEASGLLLKKHERKEWAMSVGAVGGGAGHLELPTSL
jgi:hypothetical protein